MKRLNGAILASVVVAATFFGVSSEVQAATVHNCDSGSFCIWRDTNWQTAGSGTNYVFGDYYIPNLTQYNYYNNAGNANDSMTSEWNNGTGNESVYVYRDKNCTGPTYTATAGNGSGNVGINPGGGWNDQASSFTFTSRLTSCLHAGT